MFLCCIIGNIPFSTAGLLWTPLGEGFRGTTARSPPPSSAGLLGVTDADHRGLEVHSRATPPHRQLHLTRQGRKDDARVPLGGQTIRIRRPKRVTCAVRRLWCDRGHKGERREHGSPPSRLYTLFKDALENTLYSFRFIEVTTKFQLHKSGCSCIGGSRPVAG